MPQNQTNIPDPSIFPVSVLSKKQVRTFKGETRKGEVVVAKVRYDDECGNGHNTFAITGDLFDRPDRAPGEPSAVNSKGKTLWLGSCVCIHDEIAQTIPELAPLIKWHLVSSNMPMHYYQNALYHAGDRDHWGLQKGEKRHLKNGRTGLPVWKLTIRDSKGDEREHFTTNGSWKDSAEKPTETFSIEWEPVWTVGEGKARDLDAARSCAVWLDATDEQLTLPGPQLKELLTARLPALMKEFKAAVESLGFVY